MTVRAFSRRLLTVEFARRAMLAFLVVALFLGGVQLRGWTWEKTRDVRFQYDIAMARRPAQRILFSAFLAWLVVSGACNINLTWGVFPACAQKRTTITKQPWAVANDARNSLMEKPKQDVQTVTPEGEPVQRLIEDVKIVSAVTHPDERGTSVG